MDLGKRSISHSRASTAGANALEDPLGGNPPKLGSSGGSIGGGSIALDERAGTELLMRGLSRMSDIQLDDIEDQLEHVSKVYAGVFKLFVTHAPPNYSMPWSKQPQQSSIGSGFAIDVKRRRFITNAHCVESAVVVQVLKRGDIKKYMAKVLVIGDACDLALLTVENDSFWENVPEFSFGQLCRLQDTVSVLGFPVGGQNISITQGVVSRIDLTDYAQSFGTSSLLTIQIDAAINPGNSGGPVLNEKLEVIGVAFQGMSKQEAENTGYIIPSNPVVQRFLEDYEKNLGFTGLVCLGIEAQAMENDDLREAFKMKEEQSGVLIRVIAPWMDAARVLKVDDVLLSVEGNRVANDGTVNFTDGERIQVTHLVNSKFKADQIDVEVLRDGKVLDLTYKLENPELLIPPKPTQLSYYIVAGLVFIPCSLELLNMRYMMKRFGDAMVPPALKNLDQFCAHRGEEVIVLNNILRSPANVGYALGDMYRLSKFNGKEVRNLAHLISLVEGCQEEWSRFEFDGIKEMIILKTSKIPAATEEVLQQNMIPAAKYLVAKDGDKEEGGGGAAKEGSTLA